MDTKLTLLHQAADLVRKHGGVRPAARASGINYNTLRRRADNAIKEGILGTIEPKPKVILLPQRRVLHIPDLHCPFEHKDAFNFIEAVCDRYEPDEIILAGDELDQHSVSDHQTDPDGYSPGHELAMGLHHLRPLYAMFPKAKVCTSNHGSRPFRRAFASGLPSAYLKAYCEFMKAPEGWEWADEWIVDGVRYTHGEEATGANGALALAMRMGMSQAVGHWHGNAGASFFHNGRQTVFGLYSGCLIDAEAYAFRYGRAAKLKPVLGVSIIEGGTVPRFIAMELNDKKRWTGKL